MAPVAPSNSGRASKRGLSLKGRALQWLAQREQSRVELRRKLMPHALAEALAAQPGGVSSMPDVLDLLDALDPRGACSATSNAESLDPSAARSSAAERVEGLLDWLEANRYLSAERFVESRVHARAERFGNLRIRNELKQHQVTLSVDAAQSLRDTELERAKAVRERKFDGCPDSVIERARQARFLAGRGFSPETIGRALRDAAGGRDRASSVEFEGDTGVAGAHRHSD